MRKVIALFTALSLFCFLAVPAGAQSGASVRGSIAAADPGDTVEFSLSIADNPGISSFRIFLEYDTEVLRPLCTEDGSLIVEPGDLTKSGMLISGKTETGCQIMWGAGQNANGDGVLFTLSFETDAFADGTYPIKVTYAPDDTVNDAGEPVSLSCTDGAFTLMGIPVISIGTAKGFPGDSVTVPVRLDRNTGFATVLLTFAYDTERLQLTGIKKGSLLTSGSGSFSRNVSGGRALWYDSVNTSGDGVLFELTFTILEGDGYMEIPVSASLTDGAARNFGSVEDPDIPVAFADGAVTRRSGQLLVEDAVCEGGSVVLTLKDAPMEAVTVVVAAYENGKMKTVSVEDRTLTAEANTLPYTGDSGVTSVKVFLLQAGSWLPLCATIERTV